MPYTSFHPGQPWLDTAGKSIQAHGFSVKRVGDRYCWYGENKEKTVGGPDSTVWHWGVRLYTSDDLYNWRDEGLIIPPAPDDLTSPLHPTYCMDRPHILFCPKTGKYVAWLKIMAGTISQFMCVLTADRFEGPYGITHTMLKPLNMDTGDFDLHYDAALGKAFIWFERPHFELICATLTDDFTDVTGEYSAHYKGRRPPWAREAPVFFERGGRKYLFTSGTTGYDSNPSDVCVFDDYHGDYVSLGDPCVGDAFRNSFNGQITSVIRVPDSDLYIACADRWVPRPDAPGRSEAVFNRFDRGFEDYVPDRAPKYPQPLSGAPARHPENTSVSRYWFLPIEWNGAKPVIRWHDEWRVEDYL